MTSEDAVDHSAIGNKKKEEDEENADDEEKAK